MTESKCIFCEIANQANKKLWDGKYLYSIFDINPVSPGHSLIIPKRHVVDLADLNADEWNELQFAISATIAIIEKTDLRLIYSNILIATSSETTKWFVNKALSSQFLNQKPDGYNHGINDGRMAGRTIDHLHWQIIPRYKGDIADPSGGVRSVIPEMQNYQCAR